MLTSRPQGGVLKVEAEGWNVLTSVGEAGAC
jgi:hypothetical protein